MSGLLDRGRASHIGGTTLLSRLVVGVPPGLIREPDGVIGLLTRRARLCRLVSNASSIGAMVSGFDTEAAAASLSVSTTVWVLEPDPSVMFVIRDTTRQSPSIWIPKGQKMHRRATEPNSKALVL